MCVLLPSFNYRLVFNTEGDFGGEIVKIASNTQFKLLIDHWNTSLMFGWLSVQSLCIFLFVLFRMNLSISCYDYFLQFDHLCNCVVIWICVKSVTQVQIKFLIFFLIRSIFLYFNLNRWRGSLYKLIWRELLAYLALYYTINVMYRYVLTDDQKR